MRRRGQGLRREGKARRLDPEDRGPPGETRAPAAAGAHPEAGYAWAGSFGASPTGSPSIGAVPSMRNCFAALGYGGDGITFSMLSAQVLSAAIAGRDDPDDNFLFSFRRKF